MKSSIGFVISTLSGGGAQRVVSNLSLELSSRYQVNIILHDGTAVEYPDALTGEEKMMAEAVVSLFSNAEYYRRYKEKALERVLDFQPGYIAGQWIDLIESNNSGRRSN